MASCRQRARPGSAMAHALWLACLVVSLVAAHNSQLPTPVQLLREAQEALDYIVAQRRHLHTCPEVPVAFAHCAV